MPRYKVRVDLQVSGCVCRTFEVEAEDADEAEELASDKVSEEFDSGDVDVDDVETNNASVVAVVA